MVQYRSPFYGRLRKPRRQIAVRKLDGNDPSARSGHTDRAVVPQRRSARSIARSLPTRGKIPVGFSQQRGVFSGLTSDFWDTALLIPLRQHKGQTDGLRRYVSPEFWTRA